MNSVKLLHIKCCFFQFFNSPVALKNKTILVPQEKVEMTPLFVAYIREWFNLRLRLISWYSPRIVDYILAHV